MVFSYIRTPMTDALVDEQPKLLDAFNKEPPLKRIGEMDDLTGAVVYLLSDAATYTTGLDMLITGGLHAGRIESPYHNPL